MGARLVIHAVGPVWRGGRRGEAGLLASAWRSALQQAVDHVAGSVAFPSISTGVYGFPVDRAATIASGVVREFLDSLAVETRLEVLVCAFSEKDERVYAQAFAWAADPPG